MFDFVHEKKRLVQVILLLIILPFALWGISSYRQMSGGGALATVDGEKITQQEFDNAVRQQQDQMRQMMHGAFDPAMFDRPEIKQSILDSLVSQKLLVVGARSAGLTLSDEQLAQVIQGYEAFQKNGKFDRQQYEDVLRRQNMSPAQFESRVKQDLAMRLLADTYIQNGYASNTAADNLIRLNEQQRVVSVAQIAPDAFLRQAKVEDAEIKSYYEREPQEFRTPEQARVEYIMFSAGSLMSQVTVSDEEIKDYYVKHQAEFGEPEQRHAAHILIAVPAQASDAIKQAAHAKAEQVLAQVEKEPAKFAELAKQYSNDPGSASQGGDLGFFGRGMMVKPFEDAAFSLKPGEVSGVVQSDFGYHIIKLLEVKAAKTPSLNQVKSDIAQKLKLQKAGDKFAELADKFNNTVYEQSDSLKPAAGLVKIPVQQSGWLGKGQPGALPWTDKALQAVFSDDVLNKKRNSAAVEIAPDTLLAVRLLEHKPAGMRSLAEVSDAIRQKLLRQRANELAVKQGQSMLAQLQRGEKAAVTWKPAQSITRAQRTGLDAELARGVLQADVHKLPVYVGAENAQGGYALARIDAVKEAGAIDDAMRSRYLQQLRQLTGDELLQDYLADAKKQASISMTKFAAGDKK
jgi:peptidyl-prolyl cis-trans isomerase D